MFDREERGCNALTRLNGTSLSSKEQREKPRLHCRGFDGVTLRALFESSKSERERHDRPIWRRPCGRGAARRAKAAAGSRRGGSPRRALAAAGRTVIGNGLLGSLEQLIKRLTAHSVSALDCLWRPPRLRAALLLDGAAPRRRRGDAAAATDIHRRGFHQARGPPAFT